MSGCSRHYEGERDKLDCLRKMVYVPADSKRRACVKKMVRQCGGDGTKNPVSLRAGIFAGFCLKLFSTGAAWNNNCGKV